MLSKITVSAIVLSSLSQAVSIDRKRKWQKDGALKDLFDFDDWWAKQVESLDVSSSDDNT